MKIEIDYKLSLAFLHCFDFRGNEIVLNDYIDPRHIHLVLASVEGLEFRDAWESKLIPIMERNWGSYIGGRHLLVGYGLDMLLLLTWESLKRSFSVNNQELLTA